MVKHVEEQYQPEDGVHRLERELGGCEEEREERHVSGDRERLEGAVVSPIFERDQAERDDDEEDGLLVHVPAEEEGGVAAESHGADEGLPVGAEPEFDQGKLHGVSILLQTKKKKKGVHTSWKIRVRMKVCSLVTSGRIAKDVSPTKPRVTLDKASSLTGRPNRGATVYISQGHQTPNTDTYEE